MKGVRRRFAGGAQPLGKPIHVQAPPGSELAGHDTTSQKLGRAPGKPAKLTETAYRARF